MMNLFFSLLVSFSLAGRLARRSFVDPGEIKNVLFYIQRSINSSAIIYELNINEKGDLDGVEPVKIYWKNYATDNSTEPLNYIQKKYAYGIEVKILDVKKKTVSFNFVSYQKKIIYLIRSQADNKYRAYCNISGKFVVLTRIFIQLHEGLFRFPKVKYVEVNGRDLILNEEVSEKIIP